MSSPPRVALAGVGGYGAVHLANIERLHALGRLRFAGCTDIYPIDPAVRIRVAAAGGRIFKDYEDLLSRAAAEVVIVSTPPHLHRSMSCDAFAAGASVLVEKPPAACVADLDAMSRAAGGDHLCQVGFQSLGSGALDRIGWLIAAGKIGRVHRVGALGCWSRDDAYYSRSAWAGRRRLDGIPVNDGALSNPFAHAVMNSLIIARVDTPVTAHAAAELWRTRPMEVEDTACLRIAGGDHPPITIAVTLCAGSDRPPFVEVGGTRGVVRWHYEGDRLEWRVGGKVRSREKAGRRDLLENLLDALEGRAPLICPLEKTRPFVDLTEWLTKQPVHAVAQHHMRRHKRGANAILGIEEVLGRALRQERSFSELRPVPGFVTDDAGQVPT